MVGGARDRAAPVVGIGRAGVVPPPLGTGIGGSRQWPTGEKTPVVDVPATALPPLGAGAGSGGGEEDGSAVPTEEDGTDTDTRCCCCVRGEEGDESWAELGLSCEV
jgi:hypothetical protein